MIDEKLENEGFNELILKKDKIEPLEYLIEKHSKILKLLNKKKLNLGDTPKKGKLPELFQEAKDFVDKFLDVKVEEPICKYYSLFIGHPYNQPLKDYTLGTFLLVGGIAVHFPILSILSLLPFARGFLEMRKSNQSFYNHVLKWIVLKKEPDVILRPTIAHEYDHHVQQAFRGEGITTTKYSVNYKYFNEGHARGIQRVAAHHFREKYDNEAYIQDIAEWDVGELKSAYKWLCGKFRIKPHANLLKTSSIYDKIIKGYEYYNFQPTPGAIGNSVLSIEEEKHGKEIYKKLIHGDTSFL